MFSWKEIALSAYYFSTLRTRRREAIERAAQHREPVRILFYHRVADDIRNSWTISPRAFADQIHWLRERFDLVSLAEAQSRITSGRNRWPTACITFDDGYAENRRFATPLLLKHKIPFTYFICTDPILSGTPFPHDQAACRPLAVNTLDHIRELVDAGVEIGTHTRTHANLGNGISTNQLMSEIAGSKEDLERAIGQQVRYFAFPYGQHENLSNAACRIAAEAGYVGVCSAYGGYNFPGDNSFHLRRFHADNQFIRFVNWMTVDPRKRRQQHDFKIDEFTPQPVAAGK